MATFRLSRLAEADLLDIATYTLRTWGQDQAIRYVDDLEACCRKLADNPEMGRPAITSGLACAAWNTGGMFSSTGLKARGSWYLASSISACCRNDRTSTRKMRSQSADEGVAWRTGGPRLPFAIKKIPAQANSAWTGIRGTGWGTSQNIRDRARLIYFSNTFLICPTFFSTLPAACSALPSSFKSASFVTLPIASLTFPFTS